MVTSVCFVVYLIVKVCLSITIATREIWGQKECYSCYVVGTSQEDAANKCTCAQWIHLY